MAETQIWRWLDFFQVRHTDIKTRYRINYFYIAKNGSEEPFSAI